MATINIKATHTTLTGSMESYVAKRIEAFTKFLRPENKLHVELEVEPRHHSGPRYRAEITVLPRPGIFAQAYGENLYEAIDLCIPKIKEQLLKKKDKRVTARKQGRSASGTARR